MAVECAGFNDHFTGTLTYEHKERLIRLICHTITQNDATTFNHSIITIVTHLVFLVDIGRSKVDQNVDYKHHVDEKVDDHEGIAAITPRRLCVIASVGCNRQTDRS